MVLRGTVAALTRYTVKGDPGEKPEGVLLLAGIGMEGDFHASGGERQISLLTLEERRWMDGHPEPGLCFGRYRENILIEGIPPAAFMPGVKLKTGEAVLEISETGKHCFEECPLFRRGQDCFLAGRNLFARVVCGGYVRIGDSVTEEEI